MTDDPAGRFAERTRYGRGLASALVCLHVPLAAVAAGIAPITDAEREELFRLPAS